VPAYGCARAWVVTDATPHARSSAGSRRVAIREFIDAACSSAIPFVKAAEFFALAS
jgi:hypothetical protein